MAFKFSKQGAWLIALAAAFAFAGVAAFLLYDLSQPKTLRIAVSPGKGEDVRLVSAIAAQFGRERASIRLRVVERDSPRSAAQALDQGNADLAVVRRDAAMPASGRAVVVFRHSIALFLARPGSNVANISDLANHRIAVIGDPFDRALLEAVLAQYETPRSSVSVLDMSVDELPEAVRNGSIDVVLATGAPTDPQLARTVAALSHEGEQPRFLDVGQSEAIAQRRPIYETAKITAGAFGGTKPAEEIRTVGFAHFLRASRSIDEQTAGDLAKLLLTARNQMAPEFPAASLMRAPNTDKDSAVPVHPGAAQYFDDDQKSFFDRYSDFFYIGVMVLSGLGSGIAAIAGLASSGERSRRLQPLNRVLALLRAARTTASMSELDGIETEADEILAATLRHAETNGLDQSGLTAMSLAFDQLRRAVADRRAVLTMEQASVGQPPSPLLRHSG